MGAKEKILERKLYDLVKSEKGLCLKMDALSFAGIPDRIVLLNPGFMFFVEVKTEGKKPRPRQEVVHTMLRNLGFEVLILDSNAQFEYIKNVIHTRRFT